MIFTKKDLRHILSKNKYIIKKGKSKIDKIRKKKTKYNLPKIYGKKIPVVTEKDVINEK